MKKYILLVGFLLALAISAFPSELPDSPEGFCWKNFDEVKVSVLCPDGWHFNTFSHGDALVCTVSPEASEPGTGIDIGLTINVIKNLKEKSKVPANIYATHHLVNYVPKEDVIYFSKEESFGKILRRRAEVIRKKDDMRIYLTTYANTETDTLFIITFGAPTSKWETYLPYKNQMLNPIIIDDEI